MARIESYDSPDYTITRAHFLPIPANAGGVNSIVAKIPVFAATRLKKITGYAGVAGTNDAGGYDIYRGTTSIGEILSGTVVAAAALPSFAPTAVAAGTCTDFFQIKTRATTATATAYLLMEYEIIANSTLND